MRTNLDPGREKALLEALLRDDEWQAANASARSAVLGAFETRQRVRRVTRLSMGIVTIGLLAVGMAHWLLHPNGTGEIASKAPDARPALVGGKRLSDDDLVALFPEGSCFLAEVDGKKKLVFYDPEVEWQYVYDPTRQGVSQR